MLVHLSMRRIRVKKPTKKQLQNIGKKVGLVTAGIALVVTGIVAQVAYTKFTDHIKAQGVAEYQLAQCDKYTSKDLSTTWFECDVTHK